MSENLTVVINSLENALATMKLLNSQQDPRYRAYLIKQLQAAADQAGDALMKEHEEGVSGVVEDTTKKVTNLINDLVLYRPILEPSMK